MSGSSKESRTTRPAKRLSAKIVSAEERAAKRYDTAFAGHHGRVAIAYNPRLGVDDFVKRVRTATPLQIVETERSGVKGRLLKDLAIDLKIPAMRFFDILGVRKSTAESKSSGDKLIAGAGGQRALAVVRLLGMAQEMVERSTSAQARGFDAAPWLGSWIERPQPSLGGRKPADLLDTPTGFEIVAKTLAAIESGSYL